MICPLCEEVRHREKVIIDDKYALAVVNLRPLVPGHVMVLPKRHVERFDELTPNESASIFRMVERVARAIMKAYGLYPIIIINPIHRRSEKHIHIHLIPSRAGARDLISVYDNVPFNQEMPKEDLLAIRSRILKHL